jgi:hypothetical protein
MDSRNRHRRHSWSTRQHCRRPRIRLEELLAHYRVQLPDGATIYQLGRVVTGGLQPLDDVSRAAHCARWR